MGRPRSLAPFGDRRRVAVYDVPLMLWLKAFHVIAVVTWFAGLFYLPRLFVYHCDVPRGCCCSDGPRGAHGGDADAIAVGSPCAPPQ